MIDMKSLYFRATRLDWEGCEYFFELPTVGYASKTEAEDGLPDDQIVVTWAEMTSRVYRDIHQDA